MSFFNLALLASVGAVNAMIPDGAWDGITYPNGTMWIKPVGGHDNEAFAVHPPQESARLSKRLVGCFGTELDHTGVDRTVDELKRWAGTGNDLYSYDVPRFRAYSYLGAVTYYCIASPNSHGNLSVDDVNHALLNMDNTCARYTASYYRWDNSVEVVGKEKDGAPICNL